MSKQNLVPGDMNELRMVEGNNMEPWMNHSSNGDVAMMFESEPLEEKT